jgi:hypothetical protein
MQQVTGARLAAWQLVHLNETEIEGRHTRGTYNVMSLVAEFICKATDFRTKNIELENKTFSAYAGYESGSLSKVAIIYLDVWHPKEVCTDPCKIHTPLDLPEHISTVEAQKLTGPGWPSLRI